MNTKAWKRVIVFSLSAGLVTATLGLSFLLYLIIAAEGNVEDICTMTEVGQGLLPYGDEGGCDPRWAMWGIAFLFYGGMGALPAAGIGIVVVLALILWRRIVPQAKGG